MVFMGFPSGSVIKNLSAKQETWVWSLSLEDPLEKKVATHSSILAWEMPWMVEPGGLQSMWSEKSSTWRDDETTATVLTQSLGRVFIIPLIRQSVFGWAVVNLSDLPDSEFTGGEEHILSVFVTLGPLQCLERGSYLSQFC